MGAVTYPDTKVTEFVGNTLIPLQVSSDSEPLATDFTLRWTPALIILDTSGKEHSRTIGFIPPEEFIPTILLGVAKTYFDLRQFDSTIICLDKIINGHPQSFAAPEAVYYHGVSAFKTSHDAGDLKKIYERLSKEYPQSEWVTRAFPYRLL